jgi:hypothetical protein
MYLIKKKVRILRIEDFCELVYTVNDGRKADLMIFDCCLCANIGALYVCYPYTEYIMASSSYQSYFSVLQTNTLYKNFSLANTKKIIKELGDLEKTDYTSYDSNFSIYHMNPHLLQFVQLVLFYKDQFNYTKSFTIDSVKYLDIECCFRDLGIDINPNLDNFVVYNRYNKKVCKNRKLKKKDDYSIPSKLMIVAKRPVRYSLETRADIFLKG